MTRAQYDLRLFDVLDRGLSASVHTFSPFYRADPYSGRLWIAEADMRVAVSHKHRFLYNRIPKNANSSTAAMLYERSFGEPVGTDARVAKHGFDRPVFMER